MQTIDSFDFAGKKAFVRVDFNVPLDENFHITDDTRIRAALPTLKKILGDGGSVVIGSHLGRPKGNDDKFSLRHIRAHVAELLGVDVQFASDCVGEEAELKACALQPGEALLLENLRFHAEEEGKPRGLADDASDEVKAAEMLYLLWRSDKPLQGVSLGRKSAGITSLLIDLKDDRYAPLITRLRLDRGVQLLDEANQALEDLQLQRIKARSKPDLPSSTDLRPTTDAVYRRIVKYLELSYMNASPDGQAAITELVHLINKMVDHTRTAYKQSLSQRRARRRQKEAREEGQS